MTQELPKISSDKELGDLVEGQIARFKTRRYDFDALKFQADHDPVYRRAQVRYLGTGAAGVSSDMNVVPSNNFTFSTMLLPGGCEGPSHVHDDVEEVFFMLRGQVTLFVEHEGYKCETVLNERDLISVPPGIYRGLKNNGQEEALMCVMLGAGKPQIPTYPDDHPLAKLKRY
ncbi:MAG: cupin [Alphaproteobacteria bacterium]|nr:MAG: cupin [Alphaproteobacteria bacterium]